MKVTACFFKLLGVNMTLVSPIVIALGIVDVVLTHYAYDCDSGCPLNNAFALTWVGVGIWAPFSTFVIGIAVIKVAGKEFESGWLCLLSFMASALFMPALIVISGLEAHFKFESGVPTSSEPKLQALFAIEVTIAVVGFVLWLHALGVWKYVCCTNHHCLKKKAYKAQKPQAVVEVKDDDVNRLNIWSAYRLMENGGHACPAYIAQPQQQLSPPGGAWRSSYYALNAPQARGYTATPLPQVPTASPCQQCNHQASKPVLSTGPIYSARW